MRQKPRPSTKVYLKVSNESFNSFFALAHAADLINRLDGRFNIGLALETESLRELSKELGWLTLKSVRAADVPASCALLDLSPSSERVSYWQEIDRDRDEEMLQAKFPHISPDKLKVPPFVYNDYLAVLRDAMEVFDLPFPGERPSSLFEEAKNPLYHTSPLQDVERRALLRGARRSGNITRRAIKSSKLAGYAWSALQDAGIKSGPFTLVEKGFAGWDGSAVEHWGRIIELPSPEEILCDTEKTLTYVGLFFSHQLASLGVKSSDYMVLATGAYNKTPSVIWDLRPSQAKVGEDLEARAKLSMHISNEISIVAPMVDAEDVDREIAYILGSYYTSNRPFISQNRRPKRLPRPIASREFQWGAL